MRISAVGINYAPDLIGVAKYNTELCEALAAAGHEVRIVTAPPYYPEWRAPDAFRGWRYRRETAKGVAITRTPIYVPAIRLARNVSFITPRLHSRVRGRSSQTLLDGGRTLSSRLLPRSCRPHCLRGWHGASEPFRGFICRILKSTRRSISVY